jgi:hypothetical protein
VHLLPVGGVPCVGVGGLWVLHIPGKQGTGEIYGGGWGVGGPLRGCGARLTLFWSSARPPHQGGWNVVTGRAGGVQGVEGVMLRVAVGAVTWQGARRCPLDYLGVLYGCQPDGLQYWRSLEGGGGGACLSCSLGEGGGLQDDILAHVIFFCAVSRQATAAPAEKKKSHHHHHHHHPPATTTTPRRRSFVYHCHQRSLNL